MAEEKNTVLVVEDEPDERRFLPTVLEDGGYHETKIREVDLEPVQVLEMVHQEEWYWDKKALARRLDKLRSELALEVLRELGPDFGLVGLSGNSGLSLLLEQAREFRPAAAAVARSLPDRQFQRALENLDVRLISGRDALSTLIRTTAPDIVLQAVSGAAGLPASLTAIEAGVRLALANKESLVMAGHLLMPLARKTGAEVIPVIDIDGRKVGDGKPGPKTKMLLAMYRELRTKDGAKVDYETAPATAG